MLPAKYRLSKSKDFSEVKAKGRKLNSKNFSLVVYKRKDSLNPKIGFIISKRISNKAVERNQLKRLLNDVITANLGVIKNGYNIVILTRKSMLKMKKGEIEKELLMLLKYLD